MAGFYSNDFGLLNPGSRMGMAPVVQQNYGQNLKGLANLWANNGNYAFTPSTPSEQPGWFANSMQSLGNNLGKFDNALQPIGGIQGAFNGIQTGLGLLGSLQGLKNQKQTLGLARANFNFQRDAGYKNLNNQISSYNNLLKDKLQFRAAMETGDKNAYNDQYEERKLPKA